MTTVQRSIQTLKITNIKILVLRGIVKNIVINILFEKFISYIFWNLIFQFYFQTLAIRFLNYFYIFSCFSFYLFSIFFFNSKFKLLIEMICFRAPTVVTYTLTLGHSRDQVVLLPIFGDILILIVNGIRKEYSGESRYADFFQDLNAATAAAHKHIILRCNRCLFDIDSNADHSLFDVAEHHALECELLAREHPQLVVNNEYFLKNKIKMFDKSFQIFL